MPRLIHRRFARRSSRRQRGQSLVEFAVVLPVFLLVFSGMIDLGLGLYSDLTITNAAREGSRVAITLVYNPGSPATYTNAIEARVRAMAQSLDQAQLSVQTTCLRPSGVTFIACTNPIFVSGDSVVVNVHYNYAVIWPLAFGSTIPMDSNVQMRIE